MQVKYVDPDSPDLEAFRKAVLSPQQVDRGVDSAEELHQAIMCSTGRTEYIYVIGDYV